MTQRDRERRDTERKRRGKLLRDAIKAAGLTQEAFAKLAKTDRSAVNQMAAGNKPFGSTVAARFTAALGLPDDYFDQPMTPGEPDADRLAHLELEVQETLSLVREIRARLDDAVEPGAAEQG